MPGATSGAPTSFGSRGHGRAVVDYWLASAALLPRLPSLAVTGTTMASQLSDHATLLLSLPAATHPPLPRPEPTPQQGAPLQPRQFRPSTAEQVAAAADELRADEQQLHSEAGAPPGYPQNGP